MTADPRSIETAAVFRGLMVAVLPSLALWSAIALLLREVF